MLLCFRAMAPKYFLLLVVWSCWDVVLAFVPAMPLNTRVARRATASCFAGRAGRAKALRMTANPTSDLPMAPDVRRLESTEPPLPHRTVSSAGYRAADSARTWPDFVYSSAAARREKTVQIRQDIFERSTAEQQVRFELTLRKARWSGFHTRHLAASGRLNCSFRDELRQ